MDMGGNSRVLYGICSLPGLHLKSSTNVWYFILGFMQM
jgi:hypothetical protein